MFECVERETCAFAMEGSAHHSAKAAPPPPSSATAAPVFFNNVCTNGAAYDHPFKYTIAPHAEQYSEIFHSFRSGRACSIPLLDLPPFDDSSTAFDISAFVYSDIFGGFDILDDPQDSSKSHPWIQTGTQSQSEESDRSTCSGINNYVLNGDFHQTAARKFDVSYQKVNMVSLGDSSVIHVPQLSVSPRNSNNYESCLRTEVTERFSSEVANDIIFRDVSSGISVETQSKTAFVPSYGPLKENGRPYGISLIPTVMSVSGPCLTTELPHAPQTPAVNNIISTMSENESPKINAAKSLFNVSSLEFRNVEFGTGSSGIASAEAITEAMDTDKVKMNSIRELMERKKDSIKPFAIKNMVGSERVRMIFDELISRDDVLQQKHKNDYKLFEISGKGMQGVSEASQVLPDPLQPGKHTASGAAKLSDQSSSKVAWSEDNGWGLKDANCLEDKEEACIQKRTEGRKSAKSPRGDQQQGDMCLKKAEEGSGKRKNEMCEKEESETSPKDVQEIEQRQKNVEEAIMSDCYEKKFLQSVEKKIYEKLDVVTTNNRTEEKVDECQHFKSSNLRSQLGGKNIKQNANHVAEFMLIGKGRSQLRSGTGDMESKRNEMAHIFMSSQPLQQTAAQPIMKESKLNQQKQSLSSDISQRVGNEVKEKYQREHLREFEKEREERERELEREKKNKLQLKRLEKLRERKKEKELKKEYLVEVDGEWNREPERDRIGAEADEMTEQAEARQRQRAMAEARERLEKACADAREKKSLLEKASTEFRFRSELFAAAEARECAIQAKRDSFEAARSASEKISRDLWNSSRTSEAEGDSGKRSRATLERHCQTVERVAKTLAEKSAWDLIAEKEQSEKSRLAESLDGDIKRWSKGKEGNLCALLSTLQYILGPDSGWHSIPLTEIIAPDAVKKAYRKATLCVHPDKLQQRGATMQEKYICEKVFDLLKDSWNRFSSEER